MTKTTKHSEVYRPDPRLTSQAMATMLDAVRHADDDGGEIFYHSGDPEDHYIRMSDLPRVYLIMKEAEQKL